MFAQYKSRLMLLFCMLDRVLRRLETTFKILMIAFFALLFFKLSGPVLEGFGIASASKGRSYSVFFPNFASRPLAVLPSWVAAKISGVGASGYALVGIFLFAARICAIFILQKKLSGITFATLFFVSLLPPWFSISNERYISGVLALTFSLYGFVFLLRGKTFSFYMFVILATLSYPAVVLCIPFAYISLLLIQNGFQLNGIHLRKIAYGVLPSLVSFLIYKSLSYIFPGSYDSNFGSFDWAKSVYQLSSSLFFTYKFQTFFVYIGLIYILLITNGSRRLFRNSVILFLLAIFPAFSYAQYFVHLRDSDRVFLPIATTLMLLFVGANHFSNAMKLSDSKGDVKRFLWLVVAIVYSISLIQYWLPIMQLNRHTVNAVQMQTKSEALPFRVILVDETGKLGDVNTLFSSSLFSAVQYENSRVTAAEICTPIGVVRNHPVAKRFPLPTTLDCESIKMESGDIVFTLVSYDPFILHKKIS